MIDVFDPRYEKPDHCEIMHKCRNKKCGDDVYVVPGWDGSVPIVFGNRGWRFDSYVSEYFPDNDVYICQNLPYYELDHKVDKIAKALLKQIDTHSKGKSVALIGDCYGGMVAQEAILKEPKKVNKLVMLQTFDSVPIYQQAGKSVGMNDRVLEWIMSTFMNTRVGQWALDIFSDHEERETVEGLMNYWRYNNEDNIEKIEVPTYVLNCSSDILIGRFPEIKGAKKDIDPFCFHHRLRPDNVKAMADFINDL
jgi:pimeloyl-ACP methyl ester carboxylesterase